MEAQEKKYFYTMPSCLKYQKIAVDKNIVIKFVPAKLTLSVMQTIQSQINMSQK